MSDDTLVRFTAHELRRDDLRALMVRSNGPAMARALWHFGLLAVTGTLVWMGRATLWVIPLLIAHGYVLAFLFCAFHESAHRTAFRSRWLNVLVGSVAGFVTFWPYRNYRVFHWEHHRYTPIFSCSRASRTACAESGTSSASPRDGPTVRGWRPESAAL